MKHFVIAAYSHTLDQACRFVADVPDERMSEMPHAGAKHPAWVLGHLALAGGHGAALLARPGDADLGLEGVPEAWAETSMPGSELTGDRGAYGSKAELIGHLTRVHELFAERYEEAGEGVLAMPFPNEQYRSFFPTVGHGAYYLMASHEPYHLGQLSAWRRAAGFEAVQAVGA